MSQVNQQSMRRAMAAEIVGPAGAGKTTLLAALRERTDCVHAIEGFSRWSYWPILAHSAISLAPLFWDQWAAGRDFSWSRARRMTRLQASPWIMRRRNAPSQHLVIVDQGPVYTLAKLRMSQNDKLINQRQQRWRAGVLDAVSSSLDFVIYLDADDDVLLERIVSREKSHAVKHAATDDAKRFLDGYRRQFADLLDAFRDAGRTKIICLQTDGSLPTESAAHILGACGIDRSELLLN